MKKSQLEKEIVKLGWRSPEIEQVSLFHFEDYVKSNEHVTILTPKLSGKLIHQIGGKLEENICKRKFFPYINIFRGIYHGIWGIGEKRRILLEQSGNFGYRNLKQIPYEKIVCLTDSSSKSETPENPPKIILFNENALEFEGFFGGNKDKISLAKKYVEDAHRYNCMKQINYEGKIK